MSTSDPRQIGERADLLRRRAGRRSRPSIYTSVHWSLLPNPTRLLTPPSPSSHHPLPTTNCFSTPLLFSPFSLLNLRHACYEVR